VAVRFGNVYGPWCARKRGVLNVFFCALRSGEPLVIYGDGSASRDYVHVRDIAAALQLAMESPGLPGGTVLHAASGVETTVTALADLCRLAAGRPGHPVEYRRARPGEVGRNFASYDLAHRLLGYSPTVRIEDGIPRLWQWFKAEVFRD
jgi:UDP-glucose 4-epimerase